MAAASRRLGSWVTAAVRLEPKGRPSCPEVQLLCAGISPPCRRL